MTAVVSCNLPEGVILGVDSAVTVVDKLGGAKTYNKANKLFNLGKLPIGIAVYGVSTIGNRSIGSYIKQFEIEKSNQIENMTSIESIVGVLNDYFSKIYDAIIVPAVEEEFDMKFKKMKYDDIPVIGLVIVGFPKNSYLSEVWEIQIPHQLKPERKRGPESFGTNAFALNRPIMRFIQGYDTRMIDDLLDYFESAQQVNLSDDDKRNINKIIRRYSLVVPFNGMSIQDGVDFTRFLVDLAINYYHYAAGLPNVGGRVNLGIVTYKDHSFKILE